MPAHHPVLAGLQQKVRTSDFWFNCLLYLCLGLSLWPITLWFAHSAHEQNRILNAFIVLVAACVMLIRFGRLEIREPLSLNPPARRYLLGAFGLLLVGFILRPICSSCPDGINLMIQLIPVPAYCSALASLILFVFGPSALRIARTACGSLCVFLLLSVLMQPLDWLLRALAGKWSGSALSLLGNSVSLGLRESALEPPQLILLVNQHPFHVASECNGFGVILSSLLIAVILSIYHRVGPLRGIVQLCAGLVLGFAFNTLRIVLIVLVAPMLMQHYHLMHEIIGAATYWSCLIAAWLLFKGPTNNESPETPAEDQSSKAQV